ncbi:unnamed protein product [Trichobilharzia szidati]|nr:unnamed protein product [Trichobilharzia szidati]
MILQYKIIYLLLILTSELLVEAAGEMQKCNFRGFVGKATKDCILARKEKASRRHNFLLFNSEETNITFTIYCPICTDDSMELFKWKYIPASKKQIIFVISNQSIYESYISIKNELLESVENISLYNPCYTQQENHLVAKNVAADKFMGTYVCTYVNDTNHPANFIWYHLYRTGVFKRKSRAIDIPRISGFDNQIDSVEQIDIIQNQARIALNNISELNDRQYDYMTITFKPDYDHNVIRYCGKIKINQYRRCYLKVPRHESIMEIDEGNNEVRETGKILRSSLGLITRLEDQGSNSAHQLAVNKARRLGFDVYNDSKYIYIPCEYELLQHMSIPIPDFPPAGVHAEVNYEILCKQIHPMKFITLLDQKHLINQPIQIKTIRDYHYLKIQNILIENQKNVVLKCNVNKIRQLNCTKKHMDAIWKSSRDITYTLKTEKNELVYITEDCDLKFKVIRRSDSGTYYCHTRNSSSYITSRNNKSYVSLWTGKPVIAYRLHIQRGIYEWPLKNTVKTDMMILFLWSLILTVIWVIYAFYKLHAQNLALDLALRRRRQQANLLTYSVSLRPSLQ